MYEGCNFLTSLPILVIVHLFYSSHPNECEMVFSCFLICISLLIYDIKHLFTCFLSFVDHLWETIKICHFLIRLSVFLLYICKSSLYIMNKSVSDIWFDIWFVIIFSFCGLCFYFLDGIVCRTKGNHFDKVNFFLFFHFLLCWLCVWCCI